MQSKEILRRYDEVIAQKANKMSIVDIEMKCQEKFARKDEFNESK